ncbi:MAG TPA: transaldolase [Acidobacteriota bacterium]|nr:transaldolase [Acidobacteriota bacterium]
MNPLLELRQKGQSVWLDYIQRSLITSGGLLSLIENDGVRGVTSNPSIFEKAIDTDADYDGALAELLARKPAITAQELYDVVVLEDVRNAADILRPWYDESGGTDGFVSVEPPPQLTTDTAATIAEARRLWRTIDRPNLMIKVVATTDGVRAVEELIAEGINVNITLMFSLAHYEAVAHAYIRGLERCARPGTVASVASFFVSRVDTQVDKLLEANGSEAALDLRGKIAITNAKIVYRRFREIFYGDAFSKQRDRGARVQRPLWASTSTKNPQYRDVVYVEELIGADTVNTLPPATLEAFRDHGRVRGATVMEGLAESEQELRQLADLGIDLNSIAEQLQKDGIKSFASAYGKVLAALDKRCELIIPSGRT